MADFHEKSSEGDRFTTAFCMFKFTLMNVWETEREHTGQSSLYCETLSDTDVIINS